MTLNKGTNKKTKLFAEFPPIATEQWLQAIKKDADYEKLIWKTIENINVKPFYRAEDLKKIRHLNFFPDEFPFVRGNKKINNDWEIRQIIPVYDTLKANKLAHAAIKGGATSIGFNIKKIRNISALEKLFNKIEIENILLYFYSSPSYLDFIKLFIKWLKTNKINTSKIEGSLGFDELSDLLLYKDFHESKNKWIEETLHLFKILNKDLPLFKAVNINAAAFHNRGANAVQELAFSLAMGNEYLALLTAQGLTIDEIAPKLQFTFAIGSRYFIEIAKFRAARLLWANIVKQYLTHSVSQFYRDKEDAYKMSIYAETSLFNKTDDIYINILRNTTEVMSAIIAGVDSISVYPFDYPYKKFNNFSERIARNIQLILKNESYFNQIIDSSAGSYYIENLTEQIAEKSWQLFQIIEENGGYIESVKTGFIFEEIKKTFIQRKNEKNFIYK